MTAHEVMGTLFKYLDHPSNNIEFLKLFFLEREGRYIIQSLTVTLPIFMVQSIYLLALPDPKHVRLL